MKYCESSRADVKHMGRGAPALGKYCTILQKGLGAPKPLVATRVRDPFLGDPWGHFCIKNLPKANKDVAQYPSTRAWGMND